MTSPFECVLVVTFGCGEKEGTVFESFACNGSTHKNARWENQNCVLFMCFVIALAKILVSKYELGPSNQSEFSS